LYAVGPGQQKWTAKKAIPGSHMRARDICR
jgi:hypothetical protein